MYSKQISIALKNKQYLSPTADKIFKIFCQKALDNPHIKLRPCDLAKLLNIDTRNIYRYFKELTSTKHLVKKGKYYFYDPEILIDSLNVKEEIKQYTNFSPNSKLAKISYLRPEFKNIPRQETMFEEVRAMARDVVDALIDKHYKDFEMKKSYKKPSLTLITNKNYGS